MARIHDAPVEQYAPLYGDDAGEFHRVMAHRAPLEAGLAGFQHALRTERVLPDRLHELVRLRVAFWNQCRSCMAVRYEEGVADGVTEELVCSLERPYEAPDLSEPERAAIRYADLMATNHLAITDETFDDLREHFSEPEIVELCMNVALFVGFGRMGSALHMVDDLPEHFQGEGEERVTPWGSDEQVLIASWTGS